MKRAIGLALCCGALAGCPYPPPDLAAYEDAAAKYDVEILRDTYGVPHIFGKTDADTAFGLAFAHCEDDFKTMQESLLAARGIMATRDRWQGIPFDFISQALGVREMVEAEYETRLSAETRAICEAYAEGCNHYAALHPDEIAAAQGFPVTGKDIVAGFVLKAPFFWGLDGKLRRVIEAKAPLEVSQKLAKAEAVHQWMTDGEQTGSNSFAVAPSRSADGYTRLAVNSHQPWDGPVAWYEAYLHSEEGWHCGGGVFPGTPVILHGFNRNLGWAHTVNQPDLVDVYVLTINPENADQYRFDGAWRDFDRKEIKIRTRLWGNLYWTIKRTLKSSVHGPVFESPHGAYAVRIAGAGDVRQVEQIFRMNKASGLGEFRAAMEMRAMPSLNTTYADKDGNIWYLYNAKFPVRAPGWDYSKALPGDTSETLWTEFAPLSALPQVLNPKSGFVQNCNNDPFFTSAPEDNPRREDFPAEWGIDTMMTNRARRALELFGEDASITREEFLAYKYDWAYSKNGPLKPLLDEVFAHYPTGDAVVDRAIDVVRAWDWQTNPESTGAAIAVLTAEPVIRAEMFHQPRPDVMEILTKRAHLLHEKHGRVDVPWGTINRMVRGDHDLPFGGGPDVLYAVYGNLDEAAGTLRGWGGEGYVALVEWSPEGVMSARAVHHYGSAIDDPASPHYADQARLFQARSPRDVPLTRAEVEGQLLVAYRPGQPWSPDPDSASAAAGEREAR